MFISEEIYRLIVENASELIQVLNDNFEIEYLNQQAHLKTLGYSKDDLYRKLGYFFCYSDEYQGEIVLPKELIKKGLATWEGRYNHKNGKRIWFDIKAKKFKDDTGKFKILTIARDITEKKVLNLKLRKSEEQYRLITENINDIIGVINENLELEFVNKPSTKKILGFEGDEFIGKNPLEFIHPEDYSRSFKAFKRGIIDGKGNLEIRLRHKNGSYSWFELSGSRFLDSSGKKKGIISGRQINTRKEFELKLQKSERMYRLISENANDLIAILNYKFIYEYINEEPHIKFLGYSKKDLIGKDVIKFIHYDDLSRLTKTKESDKNIWEKTQRLRVRHKNGNWVWIEFRGKILHYDKNEKKYLIISRDITSEKEYEKFLKEENEKLKELENIRIDFLDIASHELKTPLTSILGSIQILDELYSPKLSKDVIKFVEMIRKGVVKLKNLVLNLLDISQLESKNINLNLQSINLNNLIQDCVFELQQLLKKKNQNIILDCPANFRIKLDKQKFERVIINLLSNAIKYSPLNSNIQLKLRKFNNSLEFSVKDQGIGITREEKSKLFKRFNKLDVLRDNINIEQEGTGLGLYITKKIVELHKGCIEVESEGRNKGTNFKIIIPMN